MDCKLYVCFNATPEQINKLKDFCKSHIELEYIFSARAMFSGSDVLSLSVLGNRPEIYFGVYDAKTKSIVPSGPIEDSVFNRTLESIKEKLIWSATNKAHPVNYDLAYAWMNFINNKFPCIIEEITIN